MWNEVPLEHVQITHNCRLDKFFGFVGLGGIRVFGWGGGTHGHYRYCGSVKQVCSMSDWNVA